MKELAEALKRRAGIRMRQGVVTAVTDSTCSVLIGGSDEVVDDVQHLNSCAPVIDDVVWIASDGADLWIIGTHGDPPPIDPSRLPSFDAYFAAADPAGAPAAVTGLAGAAGPTGVQLSWDLPPEALWRTWEVYQGAAADFAPAAPVLTTDTTVITVPADPGSGPWCFKVRAVNTRGERSTFAEVGPFTVPQVDIPDGSLDITKFASGIVPPRVVGALPALPDAAFPAGSLVLLTTDGRLYRTSTGGSGTWVNVVNAADLTGTIAAGNIAAGSITAGLLADGIIDAAKLDPAIKTVQAVDGLPSLPDAQYPLGTVVLESGAGKLYKASDAVDLVSIMTSNTAPSGVASASSEQVGYEAWRAFDDTAGTYWLPTAGATTGWLRYQFAIARVITRYRLTPPVANRAPRTWTFEGSNDGTAWTTLDAQTNVTDWVAGTAKVFPLDSNETSYTHYRINATANNGGTVLSLGQFEMAGWTQTGAASTKVTLADLGDDVLAALMPLRGIIEWDEFTQGPIPAGWHLCDGTTVNGITTPNLRDKFVVGSGASYAAGATGGEATHALAAGELPAHAHAIDHDHASVTSGAQSADHSHGGTTGNENTGHLHSGSTGGQSASHTHAQGSHRHGAAVEMLRTTAAGSASTVNRYGTGASRSILAGDPITDFTDPGATGAASSDHGHSFTTGDIDRVHQHGFATGGASVGHTHAVDLPNYAGTSGSGPGAGTAHENRPPYYALAYIMRVG